MVTHGYGREPIDVRLLAGGRAIDLRRVTPDAEGLPTRIRFELPPAEIPGGFGSGVSPVMADGVVVLVRDQIKDSKIFAVEAATGAVKWEKARQSPSSY